MYYGVIYTKGIHYEFKERLHVRTNACTFIADERVMVLEIKKVTSHLPISPEQTLISLFCLVLVCCVG